MYNEINGDLIALAKEGKFDVITHGANCFCTMGAGIAPQMAKAFGCDKFRLERKEELVYSHPEDEEGCIVSTGNWGDINKLGQIDYEDIHLNTKTGRILMGYSLPKPDFIITFTVVNAYTQYDYSHKNGKPVDYEAITLCMRKMNHVFKGKHIGLPMVGCGLAGGSWDIVSEIIKKELKDCEVTVVIYDKK
jgi:O-acetyl-ADP-ribose deacetylase (regulator of RNase III)